MKKYLICLSILFVFVTNNNLYAADYKKEAEEMRNAVWNWDMSAFKNYSVPEKYSKESAVIIAHHLQIEVTSKNKFRMNAFLFGDINRELYYTKIDRSMIKLNDKSALDEYSELSFKEEIKSRGFLRSNKLKTMVGARIIKPDGSIREIDVDADAVVITEGKNDKEAFKKLAIKGLEIGDILDYFFSEEMELETMNVAPQAFTFFSKYPTLQYSVECVLGQKLTAEYRSINGAPEFEESTDEDKNIILKTSGSDLMVVDNMNDIRWLSVYRDLPMIRLMILNNSSKLVYKPANARKNGVYENVDYEEILKDKKSEFAAWSNRMLWMNDVYKKVNKAIANYKQKTPAATTDDLALYIYDALRFYWPRDYYNYQYPKFYVALEKLLKENNIECKICFTTSVYYARQSEIVEGDDLSVFVSANNNKQLFFYPNGYNYAGEIPSIYQGENVATVEVKKYKPNSPVGIEGATSEFQIPVSTFDQNKSIVKSVVNFSDENPLELKINRATSSSGEMKNDYLRTLVLFEDWDMQMRKRLLIETDFWEDLQNDKEGRKYIEKYKEHFEDKKKEQKELFQAEFREYHSTNSGELMNYSIKNIGETTDNPLLEFETEYTIDGLIKKAGNNLVLDAGKLIGKQWTPSEKERKRDFDAYLSAPIFIENEILVTIPKQYTLEGIENLNKEIENDFGKFSSSASLDGNILKINTVKIYKKNFVPKSEWNTLLQMIDKTNEFCSQSVILKYNDI